MKKLFLYIVLLIIILIVISGSVFIYASRIAKKLPDNNPSWFLSNKEEFSDRKIVVCVGDSITHGRVSANYVDMSGELLGEKYQMVNAGVNGEVAWNVLQRIEDIIACDPDYITILIGSNDAKGSLKTEDGLRSLEEQKLPQMPDDGWFRDNLAEICRVLAEKTEAKIALFSIPPLGEDLNHEAFRHTVDYRRMIMALAADYGFEYLPLNEKMMEFIAASGQNPELSWDDGFMGLIYKSIINHYIFRKSYNQIAESNGLLLLPDQLHLNETAAGMVAELLVGFVDRN